MKAARRLGLALLVPILVLGGCRAAPAPTAPPPPAAPPSARIYLSTADRSQRLARQPDLLPAPSAAETAATVAIDPDQHHQQVQGFGAAITDASAELIDALPAERRDALVRELFGREGDALGLSLSRLTIGASDFSRSHYSYDDRPAGERDPGLEHFSIAPARLHVLPVARAARAANPDLWFMATPWSAPGWMKTSQSLIKGRLDPAAYPAFADYLVRTLKGFAAEGVPVQLLSVQNEPDFEPEDYPGMRMSAIARATFVGRYLGPRMRREGLTTQILDWDHNWNQPQQPIHVLSDPEASPYVSGVAWHCYGGEVTAQALVKARFPDKDAWFTECSSGGWAPDDGETLGWLTSKLIIGSSNSGSRGTILWNLALDPSGGPHKGGCGNCRGVVTIDPASGAITRNVEYDVLGHASRFVRPGARRIGVRAGGGIEATAFENRDGGIVAILFRPKGATAAPEVSLRGATYRPALPPGAVATMTWPATR